MFHKFVGVIAGFIGLAVVNSALANPISFTFTGAGSLLQTFYSFTVDGATVSTEVDYLMTAITAGPLGQADFNVTIKNTTPLAQPGDNRLVSFGVDVVTPALTGASTTNSSPTLGEWDATIGPVTFPGFQKVDLCSYAGSNCSGGQQQGVFENSIESFHLTLTGNFGATPSVMFTSPFPGKFQAVGNAGRSYEVDACAGSATSCVGTPVQVPDEGVPEPGTLALLGIGVMGAALTRRRMRV